MLAEYVSTYSDMADLIMPIYADIFHNKYLSLTGVEYSGIIPYNYQNSPMPTGMTMQDMIYNEATYRAKQMSGIVAGMATLDDYTGTEEPRVKAALQASSNALLKESPTKGYFGILDTVMAFAVGYAVIEALEDKGGMYEFHAVMDKSTTDICASLNGKRFKAS